MDALSIVVAFVFCLVSIQLYKYIRRRQMLDNISGRSVLVTGCDTGFGRITVQQLDQLGCRVFAGCLTKEAMEELKTESSSRVIPIHLDVTSDDSIAHALQIVESSTSDKGLWGIVNNAGILRGLLELEFMDRKLFEDVMAVNVIGAAMVTKAFLPIIKKSKGRVVNTSSLDGVLAFRRTTPYAASKFAMEGFSDSLRREALPSGVHISVVEPGHFATNICSVENIYKERINVFEAAPESVKALYQERKTRIYDKSKLERLSKYASSDLIQVANVYIHALFSVYPKRRYIVGNDAKILLFLNSILPDIIIDHIMGKVM